MMSVIKGLTAVILFLPCVATDIRKKSVSIWHLLATGIAGAAFSLILGDVPWWSVPAGILLGGVFLLLTKITRGAIGYGDGAMIAFLGAWFGLGQTLSLLLMALILAAVWGGICLFRKKGRKFRIPFAPFLAAGAAVNVVAMLF